MSKKIVIGEDVATQFFEKMVEELGIPLENFGETDDAEKTKSRLVNAFMTSRLEYESGIFRQHLLKPIKTGEKMVEFITIEEPSGQQLRAMSDVKKDSDTVGKGMAVLGEVTGLGLPVINKFGSRDLMLSVEVIGLFL